ncbi:MAG: Calx-beta domain-containing protein [Cyanobacteria bacterium P01_F01_bin.150]
MAILNPITLEAENLTLSANYEKESDDRIRENLSPALLPFASGGDLIRLRRTTTQGAEGTARGNFSDVDGETGLYTITANIFEESDGQSTGTLRIGSNTLPSISYNQDLGQNGITATNRRSVTFNNVPVNSDDSIVFTGTRNGNEVARLDSLVFTPIFTGALGFSSGSFNVNEDSGTATVTVVRTGGITGQTAVTINISNGTAGDDDYAATSQSTIVFAEGQTTATVSVVIIDDGLSESNETVVLALNSIDGEGIVGSQASATLLIVDNDNPNPEPVPQPPPQDPDGQDPDGQDPDIQDPTPQDPTIPGNSQFLDSDDFVLGTDGIDIFDALAGNDVVRAGAGDDQVSGGKGNDSLFGEAGDDELWGDGGQDTLKGGPGVDTLIGGAGADTLRGNGGDDILNGSGGSDRLFGNGGDDVLNGSGGRDRLVGGGGNDLLNGGGGRDTLLGQGGEDRLTGGGGSDVLRGGGGSDIFVLEAKAGIDRITDFNLKQDQLELSGSLTFENLTFENRNGSTLITSGNSKLATLIGIAASQITEASFI